MKPRFFTNKRQRHIVDPQHKKKLPEYTKKEPVGRFSYLKYFCMFIGPSRCGHTLIANILNAHPNVVISNELNPILLFLRGKDRPHIFEKIIQSMIIFKNKKSRWTSYSYDIDGLYQGTWENMSVIGDKLCGPTTTYLGYSKDNVIDKANQIREKSKSHKALITEKRIQELSGGILSDCELPIFESFKKFIGLEIKLIHIIRNPIYNITSLSLLNGHSIEQQIDEYFERFDTAIRIAQNRECLHLFLDEIINNPISSIMQLCRYLRIDCDEQFLIKSSNIIFDKEHKNKDMRKWTDELIEKVNNEMYNRPLLKRYL